MHDFLLSLGVNDIDLNGKGDFVKEAAMYSEDMDEGFAFIEESINDPNQDNLPDGNDRQQPTFVSCFPEGRELLSSEIEAREQVVKHLLDRGILPSKAQLKVSARAQLPSS
jgi:hypothetical protein